MNVTSPFSWRFNTGSGNGLVPSDNTALLVPSLTHVYSVHKPQLIDPFRAEFIFENIELYSHFQFRSGAGNWNHSSLKTLYYIVNAIIVETWRCKESGHQQPWYSPSFPGIPASVPIWLNEITGGIMLNVYVKIKNGCTGNMSFAFRLYILSLLIFMCMHNQMRTIFIILLILNWFFWNIFSYFSKGYTQVVGGVHTVPGARPTKHISIEFEIRWKFKTL